MDLDIKVDRISGLPKNIIDSILTRLEIREAARTSILSQSWRYQWHSLSKIDINYTYPGPVSPAALVKTIDHILLIHCGSVDKFYLRINVDMCNDINKWILYLSRNGIKELIIYDSFQELYNLPSCLFSNLPSCLFSCSELTNLELSSCIFQPPPAAFKAFSNLKKLRFDRVVITNQGLENLLNSCPLLSKLILSHMSNVLDDFPSIRISAPKLELLHIDSFYCYSQFKYAPLLASAYFELRGFVSPHIADDKDCKIVELLGFMPNLQSLEFSDDAFQHLAVGDVPMRLPFVCPIKHLSVFINFEDLRELPAVFCIFRSSPFIQSLHLTAGEFPRMPIDGFWKGEHDFSFRLDHLHEVLVTCFTGTESELKFVEILFANAPALKKMCIGFAYEGEDVSSIVTKLIQFPRFSPSAKVITMLADVLSIRRLYWN